MSNHFNQTALLILSLSILAPSLAPASASGGDPARVLVIYKINSIDKDGDGVGDSLQLANYYALKRGVPPTNLLGVTVSVSSYYYGTSDYAKFQTDIVTPIKNRLSTLGAANIDILLLAGDLPTVVYNATSNSVSMDNVLMGLYSLNTTTNNIYQSSNPYFAATPSFGADIGHFNHAAYKFNNSDMYLVTRLGSDDSLRGIDQIDQSLYADRFVSATAGFYNGNAYVESRFGQSDGSRYTTAYLAAQPAVQNGDYSSYNSADLNMAYSEQFVSLSGFSLKWENSTN